MHSDALLTNTYACVGVRECLCTINVASLRQANIFSALCCSFIVAAFAVFMLLSFISFFLLPLLFLLSYFAWPCRKLLNEKC